MRHTTKYQVFVSSTFVDLQNERDQVVKAVLEMGHIPVGMEMFSAADEEQWTIIKRHIEESDYYVVIVAHRYGSMVNGISFTELEYDYAIQCKVPVLGFLLDDGAPWAADRWDTGDGADDKRARLMAFKTKVRKKPVAFWNDAAELHGKVAISLGKTITAQPRPGWIPATQGASPEAATELARLSKENAELRRAVAELSSDDRRENEARNVAALLSAIPISWRGLPLSEGSGLAPASSVLEFFDATADAMVLGIATENLIYRFGSERPSDGQHLRAIQQRVTDCTRELTVYGVADRENYTIPGVRPRMADRWRLTDLGRTLLRVRRTERSAKLTATSSLAETVNSLANPH